jgi:hypothetical protein
VSDSKQDPPARVGCGGAATSGGIVFEQQLGALISTWLLAGQQFDARLNLGDAYPKWIRFETEAPVDDILVATSNGGFVAIQAKTTASLSSSLKSAFGKTVEQLVRHWLACRDGDGKRGWNRPLDPTRDRLMLAVGSQAATSIKDDLAAALRLRAQPGGGELTGKQQGAWDSFAALAEQAWTSNTNESVDARLLSELAKLVTIFVFDSEGSYRPMAQASLVASLPDAADAGVALSALEGVSGKMMSQRGGADLTVLRQVLMSEGIRLASAPRYRHDIQKLRDHSDEVAQSLERYEAIEAVADEPVSIERECQAAIHAAALEDSLLIVGEPGAGKSAVLNALARALRAAGKDVIELAVDRYSVETLEGLKTHLRLDYGLIEVLEAWDGPEPGWLIIDALDATRGGKGEGVFRSLIEHVLNAKGRWRVVASIRTFDLRLGQQFRTLFNGKPPVPALEEPGFRAVRHVRVPAWSPTEFEQLLQLTPALSGALTGASKRLLELATVPFNTRLLSDLIKDGVVRADLSHIESQAELLHLYWSHRVERHGMAARSCVQRIAEAMVVARALRAPIAAAAGGDPTMLDTLAREGVIITVDKDRSVQFRHHLLFDYAASRVLLDPNDLVSGRKRFGKEDAAGLMLAPALGFVLGEIWDRAPGREDFWTAATKILADAEGDPIIRSATGRICAEYPADAADIAELGARIIAHDTAAARAFSHICGAFAIRLEDHPGTSSAPWISLLAIVAHNVEPVASAVRFLLYRLIEHTGGELAGLGLAARALLAHAFDRSQPGTMVSPAIDLVADTFSTDPAKSRLLLERVFDDGRLPAHGWEEVPALCRKIDKIAAADPAFAADIYRRTYGFNVTERRETRLGASQILPLTSNTQQDYEMARYSLSEYCVEFLNAHPNHAIDGIIDAVHAWVAREHPIAADRADYQLTIAGRAIRVREDWSHIWAHDPDSNFGHDGDALVRKLVEYLRSAQQGDALAVANRLIDRGVLALFWTRFFMVAAERDGAFVDLALPFACAEPFLLLADTRKDATDVVASGYARLLPERREAFECSALAFDFSVYKQSGMVRERLLRRLFGTIGVDLLATDEARALARFDSNAIEVGNTRPFVVRTRSEAPEAYHWIPNLDREAMPNIGMMAAADRAKEALGLDIGANAGPLPSLEDVYAVLDDVARASLVPGVNVGLKRYGEGLIAQALGRIVDGKQLPSQGDERATAIFLRFLDMAAASEGPEVDDDTEARFESNASWGSPAPRVEAAEAMLDLVPQRSDLYPGLQARIDSLLADPHPAVRLEAGLRLVRIWDVDREGFWRRLGDRLAKESNQGVLDHLINNVIGQVLHAEPATVESLALDLLQRFAGKPGRQSRMRLALSDELTVIWVVYGNEATFGVLKEWIATAAVHHGELIRILGALRAAFVLGLDGKVERGEEAMRQRAHSLAGSIVDAASDGLKRHFARDRPSKAEISEGTNYAQLLDAACRELYFSVDGSKTQKNLRSIDDNGLTTFFRETSPILERIGDYGTPHTIHYLLQLVEFLLPLDPARAFELTARALRNGGVRSGYQFESMGADLLVRLIGVFLADHKELFEDEVCRAKLIDCLEIFLEAGWPAARRLLYRLPELIQ